MLNEKKNSYSELIRELSQEFGCRRWNSWCWTIPEFETDIINLRNSSNPGEIIWKTRRKQVFKATLSNGITVAYKIGKVKKIQNKLRVSETLKEMFALRCLEKLGFPVVKILAGGDLRQYGLLKEYWLVSCFKNEYISGLDFCKRESPFSQNRKLREKFIHKNLELLAKLHRLHWIHGTFHPYNIVFKADNNDNLDCCWLDVDHCKPKFFGWQRSAGALQDLSCFFQYIICTSQDIYSGFEHYFANTPEVLTPDEPKVNKLIQILLKNKGNLI